MTAGIFARHGLWMGTCKNGDALNPKGHFEGLAIKKVMKARYPEVPAEGFAEPEPILKPAILDALKGDGWQGEQWGYKCTALYAPALLAAFPEAHIVVVLRDPRSVFASTRSTNMLSGRMSDDELRDNIIKHQTYMSHLVDNEGALPVYTDDVIDGDFTSIMAALEGCGFDPDPDVIGDFVEPRHWHYQRSQ